MSAETVHSLADVPAVADAMAREVATDPYDGDPVARIIGEALCEGGEEQHAHHVTHPEVAARVAQALRDAGHVDGIPAVCVCRSNDGEHDYDGDRCREFLAPDTGQFKRVVPADVAPCPIGCGALPGECACTAGAPVIAPNDVKLSVRQRNALIEALIYRGQLFDHLHRGTRDSLVKKGLAEWRSGVGYVLTEAGLAAARGAG